MLEENTGVQKLYIAYGLGGIVVLWLAFGFGAQVGVPFIYPLLLLQLLPLLTQLLANTVGFAYPAYCSIKALESSVKADDTQWLTYWVVFAFFSVIVYFAGSQTLLLLLLLILPLPDFIAGWVPFYWLSKCLFLVWCMAPMENNGAVIIYSK